MAEFTLQIPDDLAKGFLPLKDIPTLSSPATTVEVMYIGYGNMAIEIV